jgi:hypothetical protein
MAESYFPDPTVFAGRWTDYFMLLVLALLALLAILFFREQDKHDPDIHSPLLAWLRGGMYFCLAFTVSWATGVFQVVTAGPLAGPEQLTDPVWIGFTLLCVSLMIWGYVYWWPKGTVTHGRLAYPVASGCFGVLWGLSAGQLQLSLYAVLEEFAFGRAMTAVLVYVLFAIFNLNFQLGWWDIKVSPPHNVRAWNARKVLFAHNPFLIASLAYFTLYGNAGIFVLLQAAALAAAAMAMRFPPFWLPDGTEKVSRETALGI